MKKLISLVFYIGIFLLILLTLGKSLILSNSPGILQGIPNQLEIALWFLKNSKYAQILLLFIIAYPFLYLLLRGKALQKFMSVLLLITAICLILLFNNFINSSTDTEPIPKPQFSNVLGSRIDVNDLVLGVSSGNRNKAYPLDVLSYHKQLSDVFGINPLLVTYNESTKAGRVFVKRINGKEVKLEPFGYIDGSAVYRDVITGSIFQQSNGEAIYGPLKDKKLEEIPCNITTLKNWNLRYPATTVMQRNKKFTDAYREVGLLNKINFDYVSQTKDIESWSDDALIVGLSLGNNYKAYDLKSLIKKRIINDSFGTTPVLIFIDDDNRSIFVFERKFNGRTANFRYDGITNEIVDSMTQSRWGKSGICTKGTQRGKRMKALNFTVEEWASWNASRPNTKKYE